MKLNIHLNPGDLAAKAISIGLAGGCGLFAGYMILRLAHMDNPPADLGLNFPEKSLKLEPQPVLVDPITTRSTSEPETGAAPSRMPAVQPYRAETPVLGYRLLSVFDGIAFIEVRDVKGARLQPVSVGAELQGAGTVEAIERAGGRWQVRAGGQIIAGAQ